MRCKFEESNRPRSSCDGGHLDQPRVVVCIHGEQQIESIEIFAAHFASSQRCQVVPSPSRRIDRARIGRFADVIRMSTGRVHLEFELRKLAVRNVVHGLPVTNTEALANPAALDLFRDLAELRS